MDCNIVVQNRECECTNAMTSDDLISHKSHSEKRELRSRHTDTRGAAEILGVRGMAYFLSCNCYVLTVLGFTVYCGLSRLVTVQCDAVPHALIPRTHNRQSDHSILWRWPLPAGMKQPATTTQQRAGNHPVNGKDHCA